MMYEELHKQFNANPVICFQLCSFLYLVSFVAIALFCSCQSYTCIDNQFIGLSVSFRQWMKIEGWVLLMISLCNCIVAGFLSYSIKIYCYYRIWIFCKIAQILWRMLWLIIGSIMFEKYNSSGHKCSTILTSYILASLIMGYLYLGITSAFIIWYKPYIFEVPQIVMPHIKDPQSEASTALLSNGSDIFSKSDIM